MAFESVMSASSLPVVTPSWDAPANVRAFNSTRLGGVSKAPYDALNLGLHVSDEAAAVHENRARLHQVMGLPAEPRWLHQVHGCDVLDVSESGVSSEVSEAVKGTVLTADAAFTDQCNEVLCVVTADCLPVVITNHDGTELAVAHAGWKGLVNGVLEASLAKFSDTSHFHVWLGPAIGPEKFEVGLEVKDAFVSKNAAHESAFVPSTTRSDKAYADIYTLARQTIERELRNRSMTERLMKGQSKKEQSMAEQSANVRSPGVSISGGDRCTMTESEHFHSYRRDGAASGRMALVAWLVS